MANATTPVIQINEGKVGIGTIEPNSKLHVFGGSADVELKVTTNDNFISRLGLYEEKPGNLHGGFIQYRGESGDRLEIGSRNSGTDTVHMSIDDSTGNVGINTIDPQAKLHANGGDSSTSILWSAMTNNTSNANATEFGSGIKFKNASFSTTVEENKWAGIAGVAESTYSNSMGMAFYTNSAASSAPAEKMRLDSAGNLGIGTDNPRGRLDVVGNTDTDSDFLTIQDNDLSAGSHRPSIRFRSNTAQIGQILGLDGRMRFSSGTSENSMLEILDNGNVGIGEDSPVEKLQVNGNIRLGNSASLLWGSNNLTLKTASSSTIGVFSLAPNSAGTVYAPRFQMLNASSVTGVSIRTDADSFFNGGNVGIGTTGPTAFLEVKVDNATIYDPASDSGQDGGTATILVSNNNTTTNNFSQIAFHNKGSNRGISRIVSIGVASASTDLAFVTENNNTKSEKMRILANGNVGIGDATPGYKLDVTGTIRATGDVIAFSDARVKENVVTIDNALDKVNRLRGVTYTRNDIEDKQTKMGVIAQEVLEVIPEVVQQDDKGNYSVAYGNMNGLLIEAIKELKAEIEELKSRL